MKNYNILKSLGLSITLFISITILTLGCKKNSSEELIQKNEPLILKSSNLISIISSDVISEKNYFIRKIDLLDNVNNEIKKTFEITVRCENNNENVYTSLKKRTFTGIISISSGKNNVIIKKIKNGQVISNKSDYLNNENTFMLNSDEEIAADIDCTIKTVHDCVASKIEAMNWVEYALCLSSAPGCYAGIWASCTWDICFKK
jgi:hypothetical protein